MEPAHAHALQQPREQARGLRERDGSVRACLEHGLEDGERRVHGRRLLLLGLVQPLHVIDERRRCLVLEQGVHKHEQVVGRSILCARHLLHEIENVGRDVHILVREQPDERRHAPRLHEDRVELRRGRDRMQAFECLVELELRVHEAFGLVYVLHAQLRVLVDLLLDVQDQALERIGVHDVHVHL